MNALLIGYARVSTYEQDLTAQRVALERLGVLPINNHPDHGLAGTNRSRPGLREALASCRDGDTLVIAKLHRLARSLRDAKDIVDELTAKNVKLNIGGSVHDPNDPVGRLLFNVLAMVAEFESDLIRTQTRKGMQIAKAKGHLRGRRPKLSAAQQRHLLEVHQAGTHSLLNSPSYSASEERPSTAASTAKAIQITDPADLLPHTGPKADRLSRSAPS
jgi:DNA invertase Pin-like site-specific DNA recombinase